MDLELNEAQQRAVEMIVEGRQPVTILTGGPGTGKTTALKTALEQLGRQRQSFALAAPTGKAARRMLEATGRSAQTVHRLLGYRPGEGFSGEGIDADVTIVDEASMLDVYLGAELVRAVRAGSGRLVLVGDAYQLPSVGPGMVLADLLRSGRVPVVELTEVHRSAADSWVCRNAPLIKAGMAPPLDDTDDFRWWSTQSLDETVDETVAAAVGLTGMLKARPLVITPRRSGAKASIEDLNPRLQAALNPGGERMKLQLGNCELRVGDVVLQRKNNYELGVFNGEMGILRAYDLKQRTVAIQFDGRDDMMSVPIDMLRTFNLGYAITIHSAQGSESSWCVVVNHSGHGRMVSRQMLYTAVTRAKKGLMLVGDALGLERAVRNNEPEKRDTGLLERLRAA